MVDKGSLKMGSIKGSLKVVFHFQAALMFIS